MSRYNELHKLHKAKQRVIKNYERLPNSAKVQKLRLLKKYLSLDKRMKQCMGISIKEGESEL